MATSISVELPGIGTIATIDQVSLRGDVNLPSIKGVRYTGQIAFTRMPQRLLEALQEYREIADDGILSLLDEALARVLEFEPFARLVPEGTTGKLTEFQVYGEGERATVVIDFHTRGEG